MSDNIFKKIIIGISIPILLLIISWTVWTTKNVFSCQKIELSLQDYITSNNKHNDSVFNELKDLNKSLNEGFRILNNKLDLSIKDNNEILLDLQRQIGQNN